MPGAQERILRAAREARTVESGQDARTDRSTWPPAWSQAREMLRREGFAARDIDAALHDLATKAAGHESDYTAQAVYAAAHGRLGERRKAEKPAARPLAGVVAAVAPVAERIVQQIDQLRPAPPQVEDLQPGEWLTDKGRPVTPWRDFRDAGGIDPKRYLSPAQWRVLCTVWRAFTSGWNARDRLAGMREFIPFYPSRVGRISARAARRAGSELIACGLFVESQETLPRGIRLVAPAWELEGYGRDDPPAYIRACIDRLREQQKGRTAARSAAVSTPPSVRHAAALCPSHGRVAAGSDPEAVSAQSISGEPLAESEKRPFSVLMTHDLKRKTKDKGRTGKAAEMPVIAQPEAARMLNVSERAAVAEKLATMRQGERTDLEPCADVRKVSEPEAAAMLNVSRRLVQRAREVRRAAPEMIGRQRMRGFATERCLL